MIKFLLSAILIISAINTSFAADQNNFSYNPNVTLLKPAFDQKTMGQISDDGQLTIKCDVVRAAKGELETLFMASILQAVCDDKVKLENK